MNKLDQLRRDLGFLLQVAEAMINYYGSFPNLEIKTIVRDLIRASEYIESAIAETKGKE